MRRLRPCLGFWLWGVRCALRPRYVRRRLTTSEVDAIMRKALMPTITNNLYSSPPLLRRLAHKRRAA